MGFEETLDVRLLLPWVGSSEPPVIRVWTGGPARIHHSLEANFFGPRNSAIDSPFYFADGSFIGRDGPVGFRSSKEYRSLPGLDRVIVDRWTYTDLAKRTWIPVSSLAAHTAGV